jgi:hypothetical protein
MTIECAYRKGETTGFNGRVAEEDKHDVVCRRDVGQECAREAQRAKDRNAEQLLDRERALVTRQF